jgi:hypothetical protein
MKYIKSYENFKPITINSAKPFKVKNGLLKNAVYLQKGIKSDRKRLGKEKDPHKRTKLNNDKNSKIKKLRDISFKTLKQAEYFRNNPIKENSNVDEKENLIQVLESPDFKPENIANYIGLDEKDYKLKSSGYYRYEPEYDKDSLTLFMKSSKLEKLVNIESNILEYYLQFNGYYSGYEYYVDEDELNYIERYLNPEITIKIKEFAELFKFNLKLEDDGNIEDGEINKLFNYLGLKDKLDDFITEISYENERAVSKTAKDSIKSLPFELSSQYSNGFDLELNFDYDTIIEYMKKHKLDVKTIAEFLENVSEFNDFSYDIESEHYENLGDFKDLKKEIKDTIVNYINSPEEIFEKIIAIDNLEAFKDNFEYAVFDYNYNIWIDYNRVYLNLFKLSKHYNGKILQWILTPEFENKLKEEKTAEEIEAYEQFIFKETVSKFNM